MRFKLTLAVCVAAIMAITIPTIAEAAKYSDICRSTRLDATDRKECRERMKEAKSEAERAQIWKEYGLKIAGFGPDGKRLKK